MMKINQDELVKAINVVKPDGELFEVRFISNSGKLNYSGYFSNTETLIRELQRLAPNENGNVYFTLNEIDTGCYSRVQRDKFIKNCKTTTSDNDIIGYQWLMVDFDPKRPSGISSSDEELKAAKDTAKQVYKYLRSKGWNDPIFANSGNGYHLLYKINVEKTDKAAKVIENALKSLNAFFGDKTKVDVDTKVYNPSRICKLYGTIACKGADTAKRPHRMSKIIYIPDEIKINDVAYIKSLADELPKPTQEQPNRFNNYNTQRFDLDEWLQRHNIEITQIVDFHGGKKYILKQCPFDSNHTGKDACIIQLANGALCFKCFHNSCANYTWKDFREFYEPITNKIKDYRLPNRKAIVQELDPNEPRFYSIADIDKLKTPPAEYIKTGVETIDRKTRGLKKGGVSVLSGLRASGKSSILSQFAIEAVQQNYRVALYSGELTPKNLEKWLLLQTVGRQNIKSTQFENYFEPMDDAKKAAVEWLSEDNKILVYNNTYGNKYEFIKASLLQCFDQDKVDLIILDNLMTLDISDLDREKYAAQSKFVRDLTIWAKEYNVHIMFVAHPRKSQGFLRLEDISGTNDIVNLVDSAFILHRVNKDFKRLTTESMRWAKDNPLYEATNVIEICKDRDGGVQDEFIPLYFEIESKRLRNSKYECKTYGDEKHKFDDFDLPFV